MGFVAAEHFHFVADNLVGGALDAVFACVFAALDFSFEIDLAAFFQVLAGDFGKAAVKGYGMPFCAGLLLPLLVFPAFVGGDAEITDSFAVGHVAGFGVAAEAADQGYFVYGHGRCSSCLMMASASARKSAAACSRRSMVSGSRMMRMQA